MEFGPKSFSFLWLFSRTQWDRQHLVEGSLNCATKRVDLEDTDWKILIGTVRDFIFWGSKITADGDCSHEIKRCLLIGKKIYDQPRHHIKKQRHYFANNGPSSQSYGFSSTHVWMWKRQWQPTPALLPGKSHGRRSLVGCSPWGRKE